MPIFFVSGQERFLLSGTLKLFFFLKLDSTILPDVVVETGFTASLVAHSEEAVLSKAGGSRLQGVVDVGGNLLLSVE